MATTFSVPFEVVQLSEFPGNVTIATELSQHFQAQGQSVCVSEAFRMTLRSPLLTGCLSQIYRRSAPSSTIKTCTFRSCIRIKVLPYIASFVTSFATIHSHSI